VGAIPVAACITPGDDGGIDLETLHPGDEPSKLLTAASEFDTYLRANTGRIPNYGERRRGVDFHRWYPNFTRAPDTTMKAFAA
jgi:hypothetical protein